MGKGTTSSGRSGTSGFADLNEKKRKEREREREERVMRLTVSLVPICACTAVAERNGYAVISDHEARRVSPDMHFGPGRLIS
jgi:hypothetical protein